MIPRPFEYERPATVEDALALLAERPGADVRVLAGGQSLVPMLSLGLARPDLLVDVGGLELGGVEVADGHVRVGALTTHRELELGAEAREHLPLAAAAAAHVGNPRVRNRGTFGGSIAHADPAAELPAVLLACAGSVVVRGPGGERRIPGETFFLGFYETALDAGELVVACELERLPDGAGTGFEEVAARADDFAISCVAAVVVLDEDGRSCADARIGLSGAGDRPLRLASVEERLRGERESDALLDDAAHTAARAVTETLDPRASTGYRRRVAATCVRRAVASAWADARVRAAA